ncbi:MAG: leucine--tRNA ligase [Bacteroidetes bacterium]|nr:leucine--tRNA ligase [Bacteroidota bacterium]
MDYRPRDIEKKWRQYWVENDTYKVSNDSDKPKFYVLDMFPYPSGAGLHVGHPLGYIASDIFARYKRLCGYNVLHPMGYDAFGLPAEQYAIQTGVHPAVSTNENIARYREQLDNIGFSFDWSREVKTCDPEYYKWTQWIFLELFEHWYDNAQQKARPIKELVAHLEANGTEGLEAAQSEPISLSAKAWKEMSAKEKDSTLMNYRLAYRKTTFVNWCEELGTVLANDEVKDGVSERGGFPVERKPMLQWSLRITAYAERLLRSLDTLEWSEAMKKMQSNWIGRSEGAQVFFPIQGHNESIEIFTTRPDTIFGATFMVLAPEHDLVDELTTPEQRAEVDKYLEYVKSRSERDRMADVKEATGVFTGAYATNPLTEQLVPIWLGEYVLKDYGTGAIMAVPSDDERDHRFATKFGIEIIDVIDKSDYPDAGREDKVGKMINSGFLNGMEVKDAIEKTLQEVEKRGIGSRQVNYRLRDAIYSRQRYWGEPFPIMYDADGVAHGMDVKDLPLELPDLADFKPASGGKSPLARAEDWVYAVDGYTRETDTMPGFAGSSWYFLRYMDAGNPEAFASREAVNYWQDVDLYVGGTEHAVGHLMYSRFWHKFLFDKGLVPTDEPFRKLINQGMIQGVIESMYMQKEKVNGYNRFVCAGLVGEEPDKDFVKIPVHVDFVQDYGSNASHMDTESIKKFMDWRPEFQHAIFECGNGIYQDGTFKSKKEVDGSHLMTVSEVGKMSKRYFNVVNPDDVVERYGADCFRMYEMFLGPVEQAKPWDTKGIDGVSKFLRKFWGLFLDQEGNFHVSDAEATKDEQKILHTCIKKIREDIERFSFNTCVSGFMVATNDLQKARCNKRSILEQLVVLLAPFAPHMTEELWHKLGHEGSVHDAAFPEFEPKWLIEDSIAYPISINGKKRALAEFPADASKDDLEKAALELEDIQKWIEGKTIRKVIVVPKRMINIVVG